jgi:uncharacterized protein YecE (DUF72 family)
MPGQILVGTASWADPGFVDEWYPEGLPAEERLSYYAERFPLVEVNTTFYAVPRKESVEEWIEQTPKDFTFDVKLHKLLSRHSTSPMHLPKGLRSTVEVKGKRVVLTPALEEAVTEIFLENIAPLQEAGKLGALLLQLSPGFSPHDNHRLEELSPLLEQLRGYQVAVELRNREWLTPERFAETLDFFAERDAAFVCVDAPEDSHFMVMPNVTLATTPKLAYLRMHGRNAEGYVKGRSVAERFDYEYKPDELKEHAGRAEHLASQAAKVHVVYNNNKGDYAPKAAAQLQLLLDKHTPARTAA